MYALKARDKLHKLEKEEYEERRAPRKEAASARSKRHKTKEEERPTTAQREAKYVGTFLMDSGKKSDFVKAVKHQLSRVNLKDPSHALMPVNLLINMEGIKILSSETQEVVMVHALRRILYCTSDSKKHLFAIVSMDLQDEMEQVYTHVFITAKKEQANELNQIVGKAFKVHFARTTIARERKKAVKQSQSPLLGGRQSTSPQMRRVQSLSPQPLRRNTSSSQPPAGAIPPYNPNLPHTGIERSSSNNFYCTPQQSGINRSPSPHAPSVTTGGSGNSRSRADLTREVGQLELEVATIQSRLSEIGEQKRELAGFDEAIEQLVAQESSLLQQLESKKRQLAAVRFQLQDAAVQELHHLQPPVASAMPTQGSSSSSSGSPGFRASRHISPLPEFSLDDAIWFHEGIPRDIAVEILSLQPEGSFMVRHSSSQPGSYALTMKGPHNHLLHYLIEASPLGGFSIQNSSLVFGSVVELIHSYTVNRDILPCTLNLSTTNPIGMNGAHNDEGSDSDDEFSHFATNSAEYRLLS